MLAQRARGEEEAHHHSSPEGAIEVDESEVDLDAISAQSLRLVRSILMLIALLSVIVLWSEIHSAFGFLENISLWDVTSTVQGVESLEPITLGAVLIAILVFIITTQLVRNLPAAGTGDSAAPGFNAGYGLRHHHHHQISADADWRAGRLLDDWY